MGRRSHGGKVGRARNVIRTVRRSQQREHHRPPEKPTIDIPLPDDDTGSDDPPEVDDAQTR
jgi:hypothetical protein